MTRKHTTESFVKKGIQKWGEKFDYAKTIYVDSKTRLIVCCSIHGDIEVLPASHLMNRPNNTGCPKCGEEIGIQKRKKSMNEFLDIANNMFGGKYIYIDSSWNGIKKSIDYICPIHGKRSMKAQDHIRQVESNTGCKLCGIENRAKEIRMTFKEFVEKSKSIHGNLYEYSSDSFISASDIVTVKCKVNGHGNFYPTARDHITKGTGCPECKGLRKKTTEGFIRDAKNTHGELYGYEKVDYLGALEKVIITCYIHGDFTQLASNHINLGSGCPDCALLKKGWDNLSDLLMEQEKHLEKCQLYIYSISGYPDQIKVGISIDHRKRAYYTPSNLPYKELLCLWECETRIQARMIELVVLQDTHHQFIPPWELSELSGFYELRKCDPNIMIELIQTRSDELREFLSDGGNLWRWAIDNVKMPEDIKNMYLSKCQEVEN